MIRMPLSVALAASLLLGLAGCRSQEPPIYGTWTGELNGESYELDLAESKVALTIDGHRRGGDARYFRSVGEEEPRYAVWFQEQHGWLVLEVWDENEMVAYPMKDPDERVLFSRKQ